MHADDPDCPFCTIVKKDDSDVYEVYRDEHVVAFFPTEPATPGHVLIIPHRHVAYLWDLTPEEATELSLATLHLSSVIKYALTPKGLNVIQSNGEAATQTVKHFHIHLVPRQPNDNMKLAWPEGNQCSEKEKITVLQKLHNAAELLDKKTPLVSPEDRRKHLDYIQAIVTRQSAASSSAKGWLLPVVTATLGFSVTKGEWLLALVGMVAIVLFAYLDANYLKSEKQFRALYNTVAQSQRAIPNFTLDPSDAKDPLDNGSKQKGRHTYLPEWSIWKSWSILPFYLALFLLSITVISVVASGNTLP